MSSQKNEVTYKGYTVYIAQAFLDRYNTKFEDVELLFKRRLELECSILDFLENQDHLKSLKKEWTQNELEIQKAFGLEQNTKYHKFWRMIGCTCPKIDNEDNWPSGYYFINGNCPIHGKHSINDTKD